LFIGDFYQLPLVGQTALYYKLSNKVLELACTERLVYKAINQTAVLDQVIQQSGDDTKSATFRNALAELYSDTIGEST
jgi:hypothetical protein